MSLEGGGDVLAWLKLLETVAEIQGVYPRSLSVSELVKMDGDWLATQFTSHPNIWMVRVRITDGTVERLKSPITEWTEVPA